jgi:hypothetical protein
MQETPHPLEVSEPKKGGEHRRIVEDFSQVDHTRPEIKQAYKAAYRVLLKYRARRLLEIAEELVD